MNKKVTLLFFACLWMHNIAVDVDLKGFDDSTLYKINWPGNEGFVESETLEGEEITVLSENNEKFKCILPTLKGKTKDSEEKYSGPTPLELLTPVFTQPCMFKIDTYWTYELCHGRHLRQYHEEREGKKVKLQEYYLGRWDRLQQENLKQIIDKEEKAVPPVMIPVKKIDGSNMPYLQLNMTDGTLCDVSLKPRTTKVLYVCYAHGKNEVYSLKETSICEYEVIVLSPLLCSHPRYRPKDLGENTINCYPLENAYKKPKNLLKMEAESLKLRHTKPNDLEDFFKDEKMQTVFTVFSVDKIEGQDPRVRVEIRPMEIPDDVDMSEHSSSLSSLTSSNTPSSSSSPYSSDSPGVMSEEQAVIDFLGGTECYQGGSSWWKFEFCYGKTVTQFHVEKDGSKTVINLGHFTKQAQLEWLEANPHKRPKSLNNRKHFSHIYTEGTICDKTGKPRQTEVKMKCLENNPNQGTVSLYLVEPKPCQYMLGLESKLICDILPFVDDNGLLTIESYLQAQEQSAAEQDTSEKPIQLDENDELDNHISDGDE